MLWGDTHFYPLSFIIFGGKILFLNYQRKFIHGKIHKLWRHLMLQLIFQLFTKINYFYFPFPCCYQTHHNSLKNLLEMLLIGRGDFIRLVLLSPSACIALVYYYVMHWCYHHTYIQFLGVIDCTVELNLVYTIYIYK